MLSMIKKPHWTEHFKGIFYGKWILQLWIMSQLKKKRCKGYMGSTLHTVATH